MTTILHLDASARSGRSGIDPHGSHTRRLSARFVEQWQQRCPEVRVIYRDVGQKSTAASYRRLDSCRFYSAGTT